MIDIFQYAFFQRAMIGGIMVAVICSVIGVFLVLRRLSLLGDGMAHMSFGGLALGLFFGISPFFAALVFAVLSAFGIQRLKKARVYGDVAIAILFSFGMALGVVLISMADGFNSDLFSYLFGSILATTAADLWAIFGLGLLVVALVTFFFKEYFYMTFDEEAARASGLPVDKLDTLLVVMTAVAVVISMRIVGILLVASLIAIPAATAMLVTKSFHNTIILSVILGVLSVIVGLLAAFVFDLAAGGAIVLTLVAFFLITLVGRKTVGSLLRST